MAITHKDLPGGKWEKEFTGKDVNEARGALKEWGVKSWEKAQSDNERIGISKVLSPSGELAHVRTDKMEQALESGYRPYTRLNITVPEMPWHKDRIPNPGKRKYRYDRISGQMVEVS